MANLHFSQKDFETYLRIKNLIKEGYKHEDLVRPTYSSLIIRFEGMEHRKYNSLSDAACFNLRQTLAYAHNHGRLLISRRKGGAKVFFIEWLEDHQTS